jgi:hypothetical protein
MDDGSKNVYNQTILHTDSFSLTDLELLQKALLYNFQLKSRLILKRPNQWLIAIPLKQTNSLYSIVSPYMHDSMLYKVHKDKQ